MDGYLPRHGDGWRQEPEEPASSTGNCFQCCYRRQRRPHSLLRYHRLQQTHSVPYGMRILGAPLRTSRDPHHKIIDHGAKRVA